MAVARTCILRAFAGECDLRPTPAPPTTVSALRDVVAREAGRLFAEAGSVDLINVPWHVISKMSCGGTHQMFKTFVTM